MPDTVQEAETLLRKDELTVEDETQLQKKKQHESDELIKKFARKKANRLRLVREDALAIRMQAVGIFFSFAAFILLTHCLITKKPQEMFKKPEIFHEHLYEQYRSIVTIGENDTCISKQIYNYGTSKDAITDDVESCLEIDQKLKHIMNKETVFIYNTYKEYKYMRLKKHFTVNFNFNKKVNKTLVTCDQKLLNIIYEAFTSITDKLAKSHDLAPLLISQSLRKISYTSEEMEGFKEIPFILWYNYMNYELIQIETPVVSMCNTIMLVDGDSKPEFIAGIFEETGGMEGLLSILVNYIYKDLSEKDFLLTNPIYYDVKNNEYVCKDQSIKNEFNLDCVVKPFADMYKGYFIMYDRKLEIFRTAVYNPKNLLRAM